MHALPSHPRHPLVAAAVALLVALVLMVLAAPDLGTIDLSIIGGGSDSATQVQQSLPASPEVTASPRPTWVTDPLASPLDTLAGRR